MLGSRDSLAAWTASALMLSQRILAPRSCCAASQDMPESRSRARRCLIRLKKWATFCPTTLASRSRSHYRFHPFCGERFPVVRRFYVHDEPCYIVRRANGMPISFPVWMTQPAAAQAVIVCEAQLPLAALLELCRLTASCLSLLASDESEGDDDAAGSDTAARTVRGTRRITHTSTAPTGSADSKAVAGALDGNAGQGHRRGGGQ